MINILQWLFAAMSFNAALAGQRSLSERDSLSDMELPQNLKDGSSHPRQLGWLHTD